MQPYSLLYFFLFSLISPVWVLYNALLLGIVISMKCATVSSRCMSNTGHRKGEEEERES